MHRFATQRRTGTGRILAQLAQDDYETAKRPCGGRAHNIYISKEIFEEAKSRFIEKIVIFRPCANHNIAHRRSECYIRKSNSEQDFGR